jgi:hypothetical protein
VGVKLLIESWRRGTLESMATKSLRLNQKTQGTVAGEDRRQIVTLPEGSEITLIGQVTEHPEMLDVSWMGQSVWIFAMDFEARTKDAIRPLTKAASIGASGPEPGAYITAKAPAETRADTEKQTSRNPRIRRFNSAGRELF